jgi:hypothetical protein
VDIITGSSKSPTAFRKVRSVQLTPELRKQLSSTDLPIVPHPTIRKQANLDALAKRVKQDFFVDGPCNPSHAARRVVYGRRGFGRRVTYTWEDPRVRRVCKMAWDLLMRYYSSRKLTRIQLKTQGGRYSSSFVGTRRV